MYSCGRHAHRGTRAAGFSLLEVLVAFVILALVVTALFRLYGGAMNNASAADDWTRALLVAQTRLELVAAADPLREATGAGTEDGGRITWRSAVAAYVPPDADPDLVQASQAMATRLYRVTVDVTFPGAGNHQRSLSLSTLRIGARNPA
jgi:general secretion pathway protein I